MPIEISQASKTGVVMWHAPFVRRIVEKPKPEEAPSNISSLPLYIFSPEILDKLPLVVPSARGEYELQDAIQMLIDSTGRVSGVLTNARQQVTNAADLLSLNLHHLGVTPSLLSCDSSLPSDLRLIPPVVIEAGVTAGTGCVIGPFVYIERDAVIGAGARVAETLVLRRAEVMAGQNIVNEVIASVAALAPRN
jgi:NDP-sugar pyrophosphorylase family protein